MNDFLSAVETITTHLRPLPDAVQGDFLELLAERFRESDPDEIANIDRVMVEVVENKPVTAKRLV